MMNPTLRTAWADALRSGRYIQGPRQLLSPDGRRCAMGVLLDLIAEAQELHHLQHLAFIPNNIMERVGVSQTTQFNIAALNDSGVSFEEIADLIDQDADLDETVTHYVQERLKRIAKAHKPSGSPPPISFDTASFLTKPATTYASKAIHTYAFAEGEMVAPPQPSSLSALKAVYGSHAVYGSVGFGWQ